MPLVVFCGIPCSGKTRRCKDLVKYLQEHYSEQPIHLVGDYDNGSKHYTSSQEEKTQRASLKSKVERLLTSTSVVIIDSLNYIKGYRYELYCLSKHLLTPHCVILCDTPVQTARGWNCSREEGLQSYTLELFDSLVARFETPDSRNRWDSPLFVLYPDDPLPGLDICNALFHRKPPPPNQSTQPVPHSEPNFLHKLDRLTQVVIRAVIEAQRNGAMVGESVEVSDSQEKLLLARHTTMAELRQLRKQFIAYSKLNQLDSSCSNITTIFVQYINKMLI